MPSAAESQAIDPAAADSGARRPGSDAAAGIPMVTAEAGLCAFALGNLQAAAKAGDIWARGFRLLNTAFVGHAWMTLDDSIAELQARMSCSSVRQLLALEADVGCRTVSRSVERLCVLVRIAGQLGEDAVVPLQRRIDAAFATFGRIGACP
jgi:hypothetical protein